MKERTFPGRLASCEGQLRSASRSCGRHRHIDSTTCCFEAWSYRLLVNTCNSEFRRRKRMLPFEGWIYPGERPPQPEFEP